MLRWMTLALLCLALPALADRPRGGPPGGHRGNGDLAPEDEKAIHDYKLTASNTGKLADAGKRVRDLIEKDKSLEKDNPLGEGRTFADSVKRIEAHPQAVSAMRSAGVAPREFVVGMFTLMTAAMWSGMKKSYPQAPVPPYVNPDNMKFVDDHPEVVQKFQAAFEIGDQKRGHPRGGADSEGKGDKDQ